MNTLVYLVALVVIAMGKLHHDKDHAEEMLDHSNMTHASNMTMEMPPLHGGNMTMPEHSGEKEKDSKDSEEKGGRKRRGVSEDLKNAGSNALNKVENAGSDALSTAEKYGKKGVNAVENAGESIATGAKEMWKKAENAV